MVSSSVDVLEYTKQLEKENRILRKKLERSEKNCVELEATNEKKESLLKTIIQELEEKRQLEQTLIELRRTQTQLIQAEKMSSLGQLVAGVAHEINNPVSFISGNLTYLDDYFRILIKMVQLYQNHYPDPVDEIDSYADENELDFLQEDLPKMLGSIKIGAQRIRDIVLSLRNFSRIDHSECKWVNIHEGIESTLVILQHRLKEQPERPAIEVIKNYGNLPLVECYPGKLNQVFMNILVNAIDALDECHQQSSDRQIDISTSVLDSGFIEIAIADNGDGIPKAIQQQIFDPFFTTKPIGKGTGMGLAISHQIITEIHKGQFICHSTQGLGTQFYIHIPISHSIKNSCQV